MMPKNQARMLSAEPDPRHPGITIRIGEIDMIANKYVVIIRAPGGEN